MVTRSRRSVLLSALGATTLLAGCSTAGDSVPTSAGTAPEKTTSADGGERTPTDTPTETSTDVPEIDCDFAMRPTPEAGSDDEVEPREYPEKPSGEVDAGWVAHYEEAYVCNRLLSGDEVVAWHGLAVDETSLESRADGVVVHVAYTYGYETEDAVVDSPVTTAAYYVSSRGILRARTEAGGGELATSLDPISQGRSIACF